MTTQNTVQQAEALSATFAPIFASLAASRDEMDTKAYDFLVGSALLGIANRAAFGEKNAADRVAEITHTARVLIEAEGIDKAGTQLRKLDDDCTFWEDQLPHYAALYAAVEDAWRALKGSPMPSQRASKRVAKVDDRNAHSLAARFGVATEAVSQPAKPAKPSRSRK